MALIFLLVVSVGAYYYTQQPGLNKIQNIPTITVPTAVIIPTDIIPTNRPVIYPTSQDQLSPVEMYIPCKTDEDCLDAGQDFSCINNRCTQ